MKQYALPPAMYEKNNAFYYVLKNKWIHLGRDFEEAMTRYEVMRSGLNLRPSAVPAWTSMPKYLAEVYSRSKKNARLRDISHELSRTEFDEIVARANGRCEVTAIPFSLKVKNGCNKRPLAPSLDRIDSSSHYVASNCRLVCGLVNAAMGAWGEDMFWYVVRMAKKSKS